MKKLLRSLASLDAAFGRWVRSLDQSSGTIRHQALNVYGAIDVLRMQANSEGNPYLIEIGETLVRELELLLRSRSLGATLLLSKSAAAFGAADAEITSIKSRTD